MAAETSDNTPAKNDKPVVVRVKRKASQSPLEAFWLEISGRPTKRPLLDFAKLSINTSSSNVEELKTKKVLVQHVETVTSSEFTFNVLQSVVASEEPSSSKAAESKAKNEERKRMFKAGNKHDKLLVKAKENQQVLSKTARFEQIWRSRKGKKEARQGEPLRDMCHLYDVVRVDNEETKNAAQKDEDLEAQRIMSSFLPLLREFIPSAAEEIESDSDHKCKQVSEDDYVYDLYAVRGDDMSVMETDSLNPFPLVQVDDEDEYYEGPDASEYESDDSNAEDNPLNDYPDEEESEEEEEESESEASNKDSEHESASSRDKSSEDEDEDEDEDFRNHHGGSRDAGPTYEDDVYEVDDGGEMYGYDDGDDDTDDGRWSYR